MESDPSRVEDAAVTSSSKGITHGTGATFVDVLLGLVLITSLDAVFRDAHLYNGIVPAARAIVEHGWLSAIVTGQLLIFLFTLVRFYWGSLRYHQEQPELERTRELAVGLLGAIGVFVSFYIASIFVKTTNLFYFGFGLIHTVDLVWFLVARAWLSLNQGMRKVASWYVLFDILTLIVLVGILAVDSIWGPWAGYLPQWFGLAALWFIGLWDLKKLWPFYKGGKDWSGLLLS
jgi:hypothetical protein